MYKVASGSLAIVTTLCVALKTPTVSGSQSIDRQGDRSGSGNLFLGYLDEISPGVQELAAAITPIIFTPVRIDVSTNFVVVCDGAVDSQCFPLFLSEGSLGVSHH